MPIMVKTKTGELRQMKNAELLPAFYLLPAEILQAREIYLDFPRNPNVAINSWKWIDLIEHDMFVELIVDGFAFLVWRHMKIRGTMEQYSGHDPFWRFAHKVDVWIEELANVQAIAPTLKDLFNIPLDMGWKYISMKRAHEIMAIMVPTVMERYKMDKALEIVKETRCPEDFDKRKSQVKIDFHRQWYHTRTKTKMVSLESYYEDEENSEIEVADERVNVEANVCADIAVDEFKKQLSETDMRILEMRTQGICYQEIADELGFKTHSAVQKRVKKLAGIYEDFFVS